MKISYYFLLLITFFFISCSEKSSPESNKITFWHFYSEPSQKKALEPIIKAFEEKYKCKVETTELSWADGKSKLLAAFNSSNAPDVLELGSDWVSQFSSAEVLAELNPQSAEIDKYIEFSTAPSYWNNKIYALPWLVDTRVMYYNKSIIDNAGVSLPKKFQDFAEIANKLSKENGIYPFATNSADAHRLYKKFLIYVWSNGGNVLDANSNPTLNSPENIEALELYVKLSKFGAIDKQKELDNLFIQGKIAFWISGSWLLEKIKNENPDLMFGAMLIPGIKQENGISFAGGEYLAISEQSENKTLALEFIKFLSDGKNTLEFCKGINGSGMPADKKFYNDEYYKSNPYRSLFAEQLNFSRMTPVHPNWLEIEEILESAVELALYNKKSAKEALDEAQAKTLELIKQSK